MTSAAGMLKGCVASHMIGIHKRQRQIHNMAFWLCMQKKKRKQSPCALAHTHCNERKKPATLSSESFANISVVRKLNKVCFLNFFS